MINFFLWLLFGALVGWLASLVMRTDAQQGAVLNIVVGIVGAFVGGWVFTQAGWHSPIAGLAGTIFIAFIGAIILLVIIHLVRRGTTRRV